MTSAKKLTLFLKMAALLLIAVLIIPIASPVITAAADSTLTSSAYNPTITAGKTYALLITAVGDKSISAGVADKNVLSVKWDTQWSGDGIKLFITGNNAGSTTLYVKNKTKTININVTVAEDKSANPIQSDKDSISVKKGGKDTFTVTSKIHSLGFKVGNKSIASVSMGKWSGNTVQFTVKGMKNGSTTVTVYKKTDKKVCAVIKVNVGNTSTTADTTISSSAAKEKEEQPASQSASFDEQILKLVNEARAEKGLSPMKLDDSLTSAANKRAEEIVGTFDHKRPDGSDCFTVFKEFSITSYRTAGENIAAGCSSAEDVFNCWMNSSGHRANILNPDFTTLGVGKSGKYWVQLFIG